MRVRTYVYSIRARAVMNVMIHNLRYIAMHFCISQHRDTLYDTVKCVLAD